MQYSQPFIKMRNELIEACRGAYGVWNDLQGSEYALEQGWLKGKEAEQYYLNKAIWDKSMKIYYLLQVEIKEKFPDEVQTFAAEQYDRLSNLIKNTSKNSPELNDEWRSIRRNWSALAKGKKTPFNEFWAWGTVPEKYNIHNKSHSFKS